MLSCNWQRTNPTRQVHHNHEEAKTQIYSLANQGTREDGQINSDRILVFVAGSGGCQFSNKEVDFENGQKLGSVAISHTSFNCSVAAE